MKVDTDMMVDILKNNQPLNVTMVEDNGKYKLVVLFALPYLADKIIEFANQLLEEYEKGK